MRIKNLLALSLVSALGAAPSITLAKQEFNFLLGVQGGLESRKAEVHSTYNVIAGTSTFNDTRNSVTDSGMILGALAGLQWQCDRFVYGLEGGVDFQSFEKNRSYLLTNLPTATGTVVYDRGPTFTLAGRVGWFVTPFFMPYLKAGGQYSEDEMTFVITQSGSGRPSSEKDDIYGWNIAVGVEFPALGPSTIRVEGAYNQTDNFSFEDRAGNDQGNFEYSSPRSYIARVAWVWNFGKK